jgi:hypothetical protein
MVTRSHVPGRCKSVQGRCGKNFLRLRFPASRRKPVICHSLANPARRIRLALFCTPRHMTSRAHLGSIGVKFTNNVPTAPAE